MFIVFITLFLSICYEIDPDSGDTALHVAVLANDEKIVSCLLELGASSSIGNTKGHTPVMDAASHGHLEVLQSLALKGINAGGTCCSALYSTLEVGEFWLST